MSKFVYAVARGRVPGLYQSWEECSKQVLGVPGSRYKKFRSSCEAEEFIAVNSTAKVTSAPKRKFGGGGETQTSSVAAKRSRTADFDAAVAKFPEKPLVVFTDGNCQSNGKAGARAGSGVFFATDKIPDFYGRTPGAQTNGRAELFALAIALNATLDVPYLLVRPDAKYVIDAVTEKTQLASWAANGWKLRSGGSAKHKDLWQIVWKLLQIRKNNGLMAPEFVHVSAHVGIYGNEKADQLASQGIVLAVATAESLMDVFPFAARIRVSTGQSIEDVLITGK